MAVVDDLDRGFDRGLGVHAGAGGVAAQRKDRADLDGLSWAAGRTRQRHRHRGGRKQPDDILQFHCDILRKFPPSAGLFEPWICRGITARALLLLVASSIAWPVDRGKLRRLRAHAVQTINRWRAASAIASGWQVGLDADIDGVAGIVIPAPIVEGHDMRIRSCKDAGQHALNASSGGSFDHSAKTPPGLR